MAYAVEIFLTDSGNWFRYASGIGSLEEAESIQREAEGKLKARVRNE